MSGSKFQIFKAATTPTLAETEVLIYEGMTPVIKEGLAKLAGSGISDGSYAKILFNSPQFSLAYAWHKSNYPLPLHSHDTDCLYLVLGGEMRFGDEVLQQGDGVMVPANTPYTFVTGEKGVEFLEYRNALAWNIVFKGNNPAYWDKILKKVQTVKGPWATEEQPVGFIKPV